MCHTFFVRHLSPKKYNITAKTAKNTLKTLDTLTLKNINESALKHSIMARPIPYIIKYMYVNCPSNFLFFLILISTKKIKKSKIDSYKNVG